jgi:hypothetical protein
MSHRVKKNAWLHVSRSMAKKNHWNFEHRVILKAFKSLVGSAQKLCTCCTFGSESFQSIESFSSLFVSTSGSKTKPNKYAAHLFSPNKNTPKWQQPTCMGKRWKRHHVTIYRSEQNKIHGAFGSSPPWPDPWRGSRLCPWTVSSSSGRSSGNRSTQIQIGAAMVGTRAMNGEAPIGRNEESHGAIRGRDEMGLSGGGGSVSGGRRRGCGGGEERWEMRSRTKCPGTVSMPIGRRDVHCITWYI